MDTRTDTQRRADERAQRRRAEHTRDTAIRRADTALGRRDATHDALTAAQRAADDAQRAYDDALADLGAARERVARLNGTDPTDA